MKKILKIIPLVFAVLLLQNCEEDLIIFGEDSFIQLDNANAVSIVENSGDEVSVTAILGAPQASDITVNFDVTGDASRFSLTPTGSVTIPAGQTSGTLVFSAIDDDNVNGDVDITIALSTSSDLPIGIAGEGLNSVSKTITIVDDNVPCNDYLLVVTTDAFPEETTWQVTDSNGAVVASGGEDYGPASSAASRGVEYEEMISLEDGCYTFTIFDAFGDGLNDGAFQGGYILTCGALTAASGSGSFDASTDGGFSESTDFCVNQ